MIVIAVGAGEPLAGLAKELPPPLARAQRLRQLIATRVAVELILGLINRLGLREDLPRDLPKVAIGTAAGVPRQPRPVDHDHPRPDQPRLIAEPEHLPEQLGQRRLVTLDKPRDRRVIRHLEHRDHPTRHILTARPLDRPRRPHPTRVAIQQQSHHHRRVIGPPPHPIPTIRPIKPTEVQARDSVQDKPRQMILRQPIPDIRRHQERLITITPIKV